MTTITPGNKLEGSVKIVSDGSLNCGTKVVLPDGQTLKHVKSVTWTHVAGQLPTATIEILCPELDVTTLDCTAISWARVTYPDTAFVDV